MSIRNKRAIVDSRRAMLGKDGMVFDQDGVHLATIEGFQAQVAITNAAYQTLGDAQEHAVFASYKVTITFTEVVVEDSKFIRDMVEAMKNHRMPHYNLRGAMISPYDDSEEQMVYRDCVPDGTWDLQNMTVGETYKRAMSFVVNQPPDLQSMLSAAGG